MIEKLKHEIEMSYGARRGITQDDIVDKINEIIDYLDTLSNFAEEHIHEEHQENES